MAPLQDQNPKNRPSKQSSTAKQPFEFEEICFDGEIVYLPAGRWDWKILGPHPEMDQFREQVKETAINPDLIAYDGPPNERIHATYDLCNGIYARKYLWVPLRKEMGKWKIKTAYFVEDIKSTVIRVEWRKK